MDKNNGGAAFPFLSREVFEQAMRDDGYSAADDGAMAMEIAWRGWVLCGQKLEEQLRIARERVDAALLRAREQ